MSAPFTFSGIPKLSRQQVALQESFAAYLGYEPFAPAFKRNLANCIGEVLKVNARIGLTELSLVSTGRLARTLPKVSCLLVIGVAPGGAKIIVDLDSGLASYAIDRLLGGTGDVGRIMRALTEIEQGILSYLLLRVLQQWQSEWHRGTELSLTLDDFAAQVSDLQDIVADEEHYHVAAVRLALGERKGYCRILIPQSLASGAFEAPPAQGQVTPIELERMRRTLAHLAPPEVDFRVVIATLDLDDTDIASLEPGDIVLLENHEVGLGTIGIEGNGWAIVGDGNNGKLLGSVYNEGETTKFRVQQIIVQEQPAETNMSDTEMDDESYGDGFEEQTTDESVMEDPQAEAAPEDNFEETEGLLRDVAAPVVIELGRIRMNTNQIVRLRAGQVLRLPRGPTDPVNLVVNGKLFARGELIEVDGELGVRLLKVVG